MSSLFYGDPVKNENPNSFIIFLCGQTILITMINSYAQCWLANSGSYTHLAIILNKYHPICLHRVLDASSMPLMLAFTHNAVCISTKIFAKNLVMSFNFINIGLYKIYLTMKFSRSMV